MKYIVRDKIYTEEFFDNLKHILEKNITGGVRQKIARCKINGIIVYDETLIDIALAEHDGKSEWFHSISDEEAYSYFISFTTAQKRNNKLNELGI